jgi:hypothetical protein
MTEEDKMEPVQLESPTLRHQGRKGRVAFVGSNIALRCALAPTESQWAGLQN